MELAALNRELDEKGPSESLYLRADALLEAAPIENYISPDIYLFGKRKSRKRRKK